MVHSTVKGAEEFSYQIWPVDRTEEWTENFQHPYIARISWRTVKLQSEMQHIIAMIVVVGKGSFLVESVARLSSQVNILARRVASMEGKQKRSVAPYTGRLYEC